MTRYLRRALIASALLLLCDTPQLIAEVCTGSKVVKATLTRYDNHLKDGLSQAETNSAIERHLPFGMPACDRLLPLKEYVVCYDIDKRIPSWVGYELTKSEVITKERRDAFRTDPRLQDSESATCEDYKGSGFDRGHSVPRDDMNRTFEVQAGTFLLSNMSPQTGALNQGIWAYLENRVRQWAKANDRVYVLSGPIFAGTVHKLHNRVAIPNSFFKIVLRQTGGTLEAETFVLDNKEQLPIPPGGFRHATLTPKQADLYLLAHATSMRDIEQKTGLRFLSKLAASERTAVEQNAPVALWPTQ